MPTFNKDTLDPTKPNEGEVLTADVRANEQATQDALNGAWDDIDALETNPGGHAIEDDGIARPDQPALNFGPGIDATDNAGQTRTDVTVNPGEISHGGLSGLASDDHTQYHTDARGDVRYAPIGHVGAGGAEHAEATGALAGFMSAGDWSKLDGIEPGAQTGDMLKSVYDTADDGIVGDTHRVSGFGTNNTGVTIPRGTFVQSDALGSLSPAEPTDGQWSVGMAVEAIPAGQQGRVVMVGIMLDLDTSAGATGDLIYLDAVGTWTTIKPTDKTWQHVGEIFSSDPVNGVIIVETLPPITPEAEGAAGTLALTEQVGTWDHVNSSLLTWSEIAPGVGDTLLAELTNMSSGANPGRIAIDYSGTTGPQPDASSIGGSLTIHASIEFPSANDLIEVAPAVNGSVFAPELAAVAAIGNNQTVGTVIPVTITFPITGLSDGDELSIVTRGSVDTFGIHSMAISFVSSSGAGGGGGGGGGATVHQDLLGRSAPDQHPTGAITGLDTALGERALQTSLDAHTGAATGAHAASAVSVVPTGGLAATDVQGGLAELDSDLGAHVGATGGAHGLAVGPATAGFMSGAQVDELDGLAGHVGSGGVSQHALVVAAGAAGFMSGTDKTALDGFGGHIGAGGTAHAEVTVAVDGFMTAADKVRLDAMADNANNYSHPDHSGDVTSVGDGAQTIAANVVSNAKLADMPSYTIKLRDSATLGDPEDAKVSGLTQIGAPGAGDLILGETAAGALGYIDVGDLPSGGGSGDVTSAAATVANQVQLGDAPTKGIKGNAELVYTPGANGILKLESASAQSTIHIAGNAANLRLENPLGVSEERNWTFVSDSGSALRIIPTDNFGGIGSVQGIVLSHPGATGAAGMIVGAIGIADMGEGTINADGMFEAGVRLSYPADKVDAGATVTLELAESPRLVITAASTVTIEAPIAATQGSLEVIFTADPAVTFGTTNGTITERGGGADEPSGAGKSAYFTVTSTGLLLWIWGS